MSAVRSTLLPISMDVGDGETVRTDAAYDCSSPDMDTFTVIDLEMFVLSELVAVIFDVDDNADHGSPSIFAPQLGQ